MNLVLYIDFIKHYLYWNKPRKEIIMEKKWLYKVENDKISVLLSLIVTVIFAAVTAVLHGFIITLVFTIVMAALTLCSAYRFIFIKLLIGENSFCHCKSPWDKKEYKYTDISEVWESTGKSVNGASQNYLNYRTPSGEVKKFYFSPCQYDEIAFLIEKIDKDYFNKEEADSNEDKQ